MKVLHLLASNTFSGAENVVCQIMDMLKDEVDMVYCSPEGPIEETLKEKGLNYHPIDKVDTVGLEMVLEEVKPDIIHAHDVRASIVASKFAKKYKVISHIHGNDKRKMSKLSIKSMMYNWASKKMNHIFMVSNSCLNDYCFKRSIENKTTILHNIINTEKLKEKAKEDKNKYEFDVCYLGRLTEVKNPIRLLEIVNVLAKLRPSIKCAVVGDGDLREQCEAFVKENNLEENVKFFGFLNNPYKVLQASRVMLMSSINEGTPMALLEAFALGVPLVSTKVDGAVELITNELMGDLYDTNDEAVEKIIKILDRNKEDYKKYLENFSKEFNNIETYKNKILSIYNN